MASKDEACSVWTGLVLCLVMCDYLSLDYCMVTLLSSSDIWVSEWQRCNVSAFLDSRLNLDSDKVFGFNSNSIFQDAHCV